MDELHIEGTEWKRTEKRLRRGTENESEAGTK